MIIKEVKQNLFTVPDNYYLVHCISADYALGAGIAVEFQKKFHLKQKLSDVGTHEHPDCIKIGRVFNLVTKSKYWNKPTYQSLETTLTYMKDFIITNNQYAKEQIEYLAMPKIGCGLDRLQWGKVREMIQDIFKDIDVKILVCSL